MTSYSATRLELLHKLAVTPAFDILVIGGGATGTGIALDAATRGLRVLLCEQGDFASGTSSKSTKLAHGGVRYLEKAILQGDKEQFALVREGLRERGYMLQNAPHLVHPLQLLTPLHSWFESAYLFAGLTMYDVLAGSLGLGRSRFLSQKKLKKTFPHLRTDSTKGAVTYYDGQLNDARMGVALARTANKYGAVCLNHMKVTRLIKEGDALCGAYLHDTITDTTHTVRAKCIINAAGIFVDMIRTMDTPSATPLVTVSSGIHIVLDAGLTPPNTALMIPETEDGRVLFMIPWQGYVLFGTTDNPASITQHPVPTQEDINYLLRYARKYLNTPVTDSHIRSAWSGLRPLVRDPNKKSTEAIARTHVIETSTSGLVTIAGGKWTSYRRMAEETLNHAITLHKLRPENPCSTTRCKLIGSEQYTSDNATILAQQNDIASDIIASLNALYGDESADILAIGKKENMLGRLHPNLPFIKAEIIFAARHEMAEHLDDMLIRRLPLGLLDTAYTLEVADEVATIMASVLHWDSTRVQAEKARLHQQLQGWYPPFMRE